jgi:hypothetical protein
VHLLVLKAFQESQASPVAMAASNTHLQDCPSAPAALDTVLLNFLKLTAGLNSNTVISWDDFYSPDIVQQVLASPAYAPMLRPSGRKAHPIVLNPTNPTHNVAAICSPAALQQLVGLCNFKVLLLQTEKEAQPQPVQQPLGKASNPQLQPQEALNTDLKERLQEQETEVSVLKKQLQVQEADAEALKSQVQQQKSETEALKKQLQQLQVEAGVMGIKHQLQQQEAETAALRQQLQQLQQHETELVTLMEMLFARISSSEL